MSNNNRGTGFGMAALSLSGLFGYTATTAAQQIFDPSTTPTRAAVTFADASALAIAEYCLFRATAGNSQPARAGVKRPLTHRHS